MTITVSGQNKIPDPDSLLLLGDYQRAALYYAWREFQTDNQFDRIMARIQQSEALKLNSKFTEASQVLDKTPLFGLPDTIKARIMYESILNHYLDGEPATAISRFLQGQSILASSKWYGGALLLNTLSQLDEGNLDEARVSGNKFLGLIKADSKQILAWDSLLFQGQFPEMKNCKTAKILSMILPGTGQMYAGYWGQGLINLAIHSAILSSAAFGFIQGYYLTAWLAGLGLFQKFYYGGVNRAEELCNIKNRQKKNEFLLPAKNFLINQLPPTFHPSTL